MAHTIYKKFVKFLLQFGQQTYCCSKIYLFIFSPEGNSRGVHGGYIMMTDKKCLKCQLNGK